MTEKKAQVFNDGVVQIYAVENTAEPGEAPEEMRTLKCVLRYRQRTVGLQRYWGGMQENVRVDNLVRTPRVLAVSRQDIAVLLNGAQYRILQIQYPENVVPPVMDLSLERLERNHAISGRD